MKRKINTKYITQAAVVAAIYTALNVLMSITPLGSLAFGPIQFRISEAMTVLPAVMPAAIPGLFIGCLLSNIFGVVLGWGAGIVDVIFGSLATLLAAWLSYKLRDKLYLVPMPPVVVNAVVVGLILHYVLGFPLLSSMLTVGLGQLVVCYVLGMPLLLSMKKHQKHFIQPMQ